ncbi:MAG: hypothetical protein ABIJ92_00570 [Candidatus Aenigmatarchaeota archaeon]
MGLFGKKKRKIQRPPSYRPAERSYYQEEPVVTTREYRLYKKGDEEKPGWYEVLVKAVGSMAKIDPDRGSKEKLESAILFTEMDITPAEIMGLMATTIIFFILLGVTFIITGIVSVMIGLVIAAMGFLVAYYFYKYPSSRVKTLRIQASSQVVLAILYMVVSMRVSPNMERALRFAASNVSGALAWDLRKLIWDIEMRKYYSANDALDDYIIRWKFENEEFAEALRLIRDSQSQTPDRAKKELDQALEVILTGTKTRMKHYAQDLLMPVMVIHMMGIVLPIMGTIMAPMAAVFLSDLVSPIHFIIGYDIALPIIITWFILNTLNKRPVTLSQIDISKHPDVPKNHSFSIKGRSIPAWPISLLIIIGFWILPIIYFGTTPELLFPPTGAGTIPVLDTNPQFTMLMSSFFIMGLGFAISAFLLLSNYQKQRIQEEIESIESEFELALFKLGNKISGGTPTEVAIERAIDDVKDLKIAGLFKRSLANIKTLGMTFEDSLFHKKWGALQYYPSKIINNIMYAVIDTSKKGVTYAADSMLRISRYLKNIRETQEYIRELLTETTSSMKFQAYFLTPIITGMIVAMADIIIQVLVTMGQLMQNAGFEDSLGIDISLLIVGAPSTSPALFQLIIGIYLIQVIMILGMFLTKISKGDNPVAQWNNIGKMIIVGLVLYFLVMFGVSTMFGGLIEDAMSQFLVTS